MPNVVLPLDQWCQNSAKEEWVEFPLSTFRVPQITLPLSKALLCIALVACWCVSYDNRHRIACLLPSLTTLHYYFGLILRVAATADLDDESGTLVESGIYADYAIVSKDTSLGISFRPGIGNHVLNVASRWRRTMQPAMHMT